MLSKISVSAYSDAIAGAAQVAPRAPLVVEAPDPDSAWLADMMCTISSVTAPEGNHSTRERASGSEVIPPPLAKFALVGVLSVGRGEKGRWWPIGGEVVPIGLARLALWPARAKDLEMRPTDLSDSARARSFPGLGVNLELVSKGGELGVRVGHGFSLEVREPGTPPWSGPRLASQSSLRRVAR